MASGFLTIPFRGEKDRLHSVIYSIESIFKVQCFSRPKIDTSRGPKPDECLKDSLSGENESCGRSSCLPGEEECNVSSDNKETPVDEELILFLQAKSSQEDLEKAKNFAKLHLVPEEGDYVQSSEKISPQALSMVLQCSQDLQASTLALITLDPQNSNITFHGHQRNVDEAKFRVKMILDNFERKRDTIDSRCNVSYPTSDTALQWDINQVARELSSGASSHFAAQHLLPSNHQDRESFKYESGSGQSVETTEDPFNCQSLERTHTGVRRNSSVSSFSSSLSCEDDDDDVIRDPVLTDPTYNQRVEDGLKLGYSENDVQVALTKLGPNCAKNDLLSELIKIRNVSPGEGCNESTPTSLEQDFVFGQSLYASSSPITTNPQLLDSGRRRVSGDLVSDFQNAVSFKGEPVDLNDSSNLRHIIIDGSNVAMSHGKNVFSCRGIQLAVDWFRSRGHKKITVFIPQWRKETSRPDAPIIDQEILTQLDKEKVVVFTPARRVKGQRVVCYDDRYILNLAVVEEGIVVSNDVYRDLYKEKEEFSNVIDNRLLMYSFAGDRFMPPEDPYGRSGPSLDNLLRKTRSEPSPRPQDCPYGKKCTYGNKCRYYHPERGFGPHKSVTETLKERADLKLQERKLSLMATSSAAGRRPKQKLTRTKSLIPGEALSQTDWSEKPRLVHSKSLVASPASKNPEYLDESRKKLEAELERAALEESFSASQQAASGPSSLLVSRGRKKKRSVCGEDLLLHQQQGNSPRSSPVAEVEKTNVSSSSSNVVLPPPASSPAKILPHHLTVPKADQAEGYISGHLLLAKNLSDEFSDHPSSPSSTRTSSPVVPHKLSERGASRSEHSSRENLLDDTPSKARLQMMERAQAGTSAQNSFTNLSGLQQGLSMGYPTQQGMSATSNMYSSQDLLETKSQSHQGQYPSEENLPNLSIFSQDTSLGQDSTTTSNPMDNNLSQAYLSQQTPFTGANFSSDGLKSYPWSSQEAARYYNLQQQQQPENLRRSYSLASNAAMFSEAPPQPQQPHQGEHSALRPQFSVPLQQKKAPRRQSQPLVTSKPNSSSEPQLHNFPGNSHSAMGGGGLGMYPPQPQEDFSHMRQFQAHHQQHQTGYQQFAPADPSLQTNLWAEPPNYSPTLPPYQLVSHRHSDMHTYQPQTSHHQSSGQVPFSSAFSPRHSSQHFGYPPPPPQGYAYYPLQGPPPSSQSGYPQANFPAHGEASLFQHPPPSLGHHQASLGEDEPIDTNDPRYKTFFHLRMLFGEPVVRKVMNKNPSVHDPEQLCQLIIKFKQESGL